MEQTKQWERVKELFEAGIQCPPEERANFLREACGSDDSLRAEVESLLSAYTQSDGLSEGPWPSDVAEDPQFPSSIGPYRLIRKIGQGGMGQVWLAQQTEPIHRLVALKLIRGVLHDEFVLRRFQAERQSLAIMDHPAIAKVFDAGTAPNGQPYFVMEYVPGEPINEYCDRRKLPVRERLELFIKVCEGVQHAHQKAVIHRDLKPANILVVEIDGKPMPRIIDFGLAKEVAPTAPDEALITRVGAFVGTLGYMSPEQADPRLKDIDTRTDVYSLGVILYELLVGALPFDLTQLQKRPLDEVLRQLREQDAPRPSARAGTEKSYAEMRGTDPKRLVSLLHGDLDWIVMKALEKDRGRRYGAASELAADINRYLHHQPVVARAASPGYLIRKYFARHRLAVTVALGGFVLLAGFAVVEAVQLRRISRERDRANRITDFMTGMFKVADPGQARGNNVTAREILDNASKEIDTGLAQDPELQSQMMMVMGAVYENLGLYDRAESLYRQSEAIRERQLGPENTDTLKAKAALAWALYRRGHYRESEDLLRQTLAIRTRRFGANNLDTMAVMDSLGAVLNEEGHSADAEKMERQVLAFRLRVLGDRNPDTLVTMNHLALTLQGQGRWAEAEAMNRQQVAGWRQIEGADSPRGLYGADNLAIILYREGRLPEAESLDRETLATKRRVLGLDHPETVRSMNTLTAVLTDEGKLNEAETLARQVLDIRTRVLGPDHPLTISAMSNLAEILTRQGDYDEAGKLLVKAQATSIKVQGLDNQGTALVTYNLACLELRRGRRSEALQLLRQAANHGLANWVWKGMANDPDLAPLRGDPGFEALVAQAKQPAATKP